VLWCHSIGAPGMLNGARSDDGWPCALGWAPAPTPPPTPPPPAVCVRLRPGYQGAYGITAVVESHPFDLDKMLFMDWRDDHLDDYPALKQSNNKWVGVEAGRTNSKHELFPTADVMRDDQQTHPIVHMSTHVPSLPPLVKGITS
jgi:hypothetical protein